MRIPDPGNSREYRPPIPVPKVGNGIFHSHSRSRKWEWNFMEFSFPFPKIGLEFSTWIPVPEKWEWNLPFPVPVPEVQKSFPLMAGCVAGGDMRVHICVPQLCLMLTQYQSIMLIHRMYNLVKYCITIVQACLQLSAHYGCNDEPNDGVTKCNSARSSLGRASTQRAASQ